MRTGFHNKRQPNAAQSQTRRSESEEVRLRHLRQKIQPAVELEGTFRYAHEGATLQMRAVPQEVFNLIVAGEAQEDSHGTKAVQVSDTIVS